MDILLDKKIDEDLKQKFYDVILATYPNKEKLQKDPDVLEAFESIVTIIGVNAEISFFKMRNFLHIILYNYLWAKGEIDYCLKDWDFSELVESFSLKDLLKFINSDDNLEYYLIYNYYQKLANDYALEFIDNSYEIINDIPWLNTWHKPFTQDFDLITTKLKMVTSSLYEYCDYTCSDAKDTIILDFFIHHKDFFGVTKEHFNNAAEFFSYAPILNEMLYLDSYYYLESKAKLNAAEIEILNFVKKQIRNNQINVLPHDEYLLLQILQCSLFINIHRADFIRKHPRELVKVQKLVKEKANKILLFEYC